jgi:hypothetical protein
VFPRAPSGERYFNAERAKGRLGTTRTASEGAGMSWPARAFFRHIATRLVAARRRSEAVPAQLPRSAKSPDASCHWVRLDDAFDRGLAVRIIGARKGARGPQRCFRKRWPPERSLNVAPGATLIVSSWSPWQFCGGLFSRQPVGFARCWAQRSALQRLW